MAGPDTILVLAGMGVTPYSARGLTQTVQVIAEGTHIERSVNGGLVDLSPSQMRKYASKITCQDQESPALGGIWPGAVVTVDCVFELAYPTANPLLQDRTAVPGSVRTEGAWTFYRPQLEMMVMSYNTSTDEYGRVINWELDLEET